MSCRCSVMILVSSSLALQMASFHFLTKVGFSLSMIRGFTLILNLFGIQFFWTAQVGCPSGSWPCPACQAFQGRLLWIWSLIVPQSWRGIPCVWWLVLDLVSWAQHTVSAAGRPQTLPIIPLVDIHCHCWLGWWIVVSRRWKYLPTDYPQWTCPFVWSARWSDWWSHLVEVVGCCCHNWSCLHCRACCRV